MDHSGNARKTGGRASCLLLAAVLLTGCASLLERSYSTAEPHSSRFWESEAAGTLRAENHSDIVNDLLLLIGQHTESATLRLYNFGDDLTVSDTMEAAAVEIQQQTPLGSYAVSYVTFVSQAQRGYYEVKVQIGYRRTAEQIQEIANATSPEAVYSLLESALDEGRTELAVRIGYWGQNGREQVAQAVEAIRSDRGLVQSPPWEITYYPENGPTGLVEFVWTVYQPESPAAPFRFDGTMAEPGLYGGVPIEGAGGAGPDEVPDGTGEEPGGEQGQTGW